MFKKITVEEQLRIERGKVMELTNINMINGVEMSEREINEIMMGMQISDLEIQLLELGGI